MIGDQLVSLGAVSATGPVPLFFNLLMDAFESFDAGSDRGGLWCGRAPEGRERAQSGSVPINGLVSKVTKIGPQLVSFAVGVRYWAESPDGGPHGWGARFVITLLFPK